MVVISTSEVYRQIYVGLPVYLSADCKAQLRLLELRDCTDYYQICNEPSVARWAGASKPLASEREAFRVVQATVRGYQGGYGTRLAVAVNDPEVGTRLAGCISVQIQAGCVQGRSGLKVRIGYWLTAKHRGFGLVTSALKHVLSTLDSMQLGVPIEVTAGVLPGNVGSQRILTNLGFQRVGSEWGYGLQGVAADRVEQYGILLGNPK